jgi:hypothetical protein
MTVTHSNDLYKTHMNFPLSSIIFMLLLRANIYLAQYKGSGLQLLVSENGGKEFVAARFPFSYLPENVCHPFLFVLTF